MKKEIKINIDIDSKKFNESINYSDFFLKAKRRTRSDKVMKMFSSMCLTFPLVFFIYIFFSISVDAYYAFNKPKVFIDIGSNVTTDSPSIESTEFILLRYLNEYSDNIYLDTLSELFSIKTMRAIRENRVGWFELSSVYSDAYKHTTKDLHINSILSDLKKHKKINVFFNTTIFFRGDSVDPNNAGILASLIASIYTIFVCLVISAPVGVLAGLFIEDMMHKGRLRTFCETSINNLSSTPTIILGMIGLELYINVLHLPRASSLVAGLTLSFVMIPIITNTTQQASHAIPRSIREGAIALGATQLQTILHHVLPISVPRICTGIILGIARIIGEASPLLFIGMAAFIPEIPNNLTEPTITFPMQIYAWTKRPEKTFNELISVISLILLIILLVSNLVTLLIRKKFSSHLIHH